MSHNNQSEINDDIIKQLKYELASCSRELHAHRETVSEKQKAIDSLQKEIGYAQRITIPMLINRQNFLEGKISAESQPMADTKQGNKKEELGVSSRNLWSVEQIQTLTRLIIEKQCGLHDAWNHPALQALGYVMKDGNWWPFKHSVVAQAIKMATHTDDSLSGNVLKAFSDANFSYTRLQFTEALLPQLKKRKAAQAEQLLKHLRTKENLNAPATATADGLLRAIESFY